MLPALLAVPACLGASHSYYVVDSLQDKNNVAFAWTVNGESAGPSAQGLTITSGSGASYITRVTTASKAYEVAETLALQKSGGTYVIYLRATKDALFGAQSTGSFYAFVISDPLISTNGCTASAALYRALNGAAVQIDSTSIACGKAVKYEAAVDEDSSLHLSSNGVEYLTWKDTHPLSGSGGIGASGMPAENAITMVEIGSYGDTAPSANQDASLDFLSKPSPSGDIPTATPIPADIGFCNPPDDTGEDETDFTYPGLSPTGYVDCYLPSSSGGGGPGGGKPPSVCTFRAQYHTFSGVAAHGYVTWTTNIMSSYYIFEGYEENATDLLLVNLGSFPYTTATPSTDPVVAYVSSSSSCTYLINLSTSQTRINNAKIAYHILGPNSNSVWRYIVSQISGLNTFTPPLGAVGYSTKLPGVE